MIFKESYTLIRYLYSITTFRTKTKLENSTLNFKVKIDENSINYCPDSVAVSC
jgi:hypothetical protein